MTQTNRGPRFAPSDLVDFVIVGSGAAGGILAKELSAAGFAVVVLEQGPRLGPADFDHDEFGMAYQMKLANHPLTQPHTFRATAADTARPMLAVIYGRLVGGSNAHFTGNFWRLRPIDFNEASVLGGVPRAGLVDWPITYDELEPYYTKVEWDVGVSGLAGASPFEPPRTKPYPMPPLPVKSSGVLMEKGARALGLHAQPTPMAINSEPYDGRPPCQHCGFCLFFMCEFGAKSTSMAAMLPRAEATGRCELRPGSYVARVETNDSGRATGVAYFDAKKRLHLQRAKAVVLCANGAETPRLLLNSASSRFPNGLANSSGAVGKYLMFNTSLPVETNTIGIDPSLKDGWGLPCMRVTYFDHPDDLKCAEFLVARATEIAQAAGAIKTWPERVQPQTLAVHLLGTCRMGNDRRTSVIDRFHRTHDVPNLFICDGSSMVTSSRGQPTETISALAFRAGEHITALAKRGEI